MISGEYLISSWIISKGLALSYIVAFLSLMPQIMGLYGRQGILSINHLLSLLDKEMKLERFYHFPSVFWFWSSDFALRFICFIGLVSSTMAFLGFSQTIMFVVAWVCYLSFVSCGQVFLSFQWDSLLLELGFIGFFFAPFDIEWLTDSVHVLHPYILFSVWFLLFKLMFLSGSVKLINKDYSWKKLTALEYHYWTQPLPNPIAYWVNKMPRGFHKISTVLMFFFELVVPFGIIFEGSIRSISAGLLLIFQLLIVLTGNFAFFNLITIVMALSLVRDTDWGNFNFVTSLPAISNVTAMFTLILLIPPSAFWIYKTFKETSKTSDFFLPVMRLLLPFRISNPYGLFSMMTKSRPEIVLEGSMDGVLWISYEFKYKPGKLERRPPIVAPHQPRLDWQMWFAALEGFEENMWLQNVVVRVFERSPEVLGLFASNPFPDFPPQYLRLTLFDYRFSSLEEFKKEGLWWQRKPLGPYSPTFEINDFKS